MYIISTEMYKILRCTYRGVLLLIRFVVSLRSRRCVQALIMVSNDYHISVSYLSFLLKCRRVVFRGFCEVVEFVDQKF